MKLSVIVPTYRRPERLARLLNCLQAQDFARDRWSIVVVNDGSHDGAYARILSGYDGFARYVRLERRGGPSRARNAGARLATGDFLAFTDDDCEPPRNWLSRLAAFLQDHPDAAIVGGTVRGLPGARPRLMQRYLEEIGFQAPLVQGGEIAALCSANLAVRRNWFCRVGGFDERFPRPGAEDFDLCRRLAAAGAKQSWARDWVNHHCHPSTFPEFCKRFFLYGYGTALQVRHRNEPSDSGLLLTPSIPRALAALPRLVHGAWTPVKAELRPDQPAGRFLAFHLFALLRHLSYQAGGLCAMRRRL